MLRLSPRPRNRLYTDLNSYLRFLGYVLGGRLRNNQRDIRAFEAALRDRFGARHALCVYQCRVGIYLAIKALIKPGQDVILSPYTVSDVVNMVIFAGGRPVFADIDRNTCGLSPLQVERLISAETGAVLMTHLHGVAAGAHRIRKICDRFEVPLVEDCAQAFGLNENGRAAGTIGDVGIFSFELHKNVPTWLGGAIVTNRDDVIEACLGELETFSFPPLPGIMRKVKAGFINDIAGAPVLFQLVTYPILRLGYLQGIDFINRLMRRNPQLSKPATELPDAYRSRYTPFQARIGLSKLRDVDRDAQTRIEKGILYYDSLKDIDQLILPPDPAKGSNTCLWFPIQYSQREELLRFMIKHGRDIAVGHFVNNAEAPRFKEFYRDCPNGRAVEKELLYLPAYPGYPRHEVERNIAVIRKYFSTQAKSQAQDETSSCALRIQGDLASRDRLSA